MLAFPTHMPTRIAGRHNAITLLVLVFAAALSANCAGRRTSPAAVAPAPPAPPITISVVGTSDLHGHLEMLPLLGGYLANLRAARAADGGGVVLVDAGDMFQGLLDSNLNEGQAVVEAYELLGYDAVAVGNHEFDFGPVGPRSTPQEPGDDPRGALIARAAEADFPFLLANVELADAGQRPSWPNMPATTLRTVAGVKIGIIGVTSIDTPQTTHPINFRGLRMAPLVDTIIREASGLRAAGAAVVVVSAHAGGRCTEHADPRILDSCDPSQEIFEVAKALPAGTVELIVAGHTHSLIAHWVNGVPIVESYANGRAFGRIDVVVDPATQKVLERRILPPQDLCANGRDRRTPQDPCNPFDYEGRAVTANPDIAAVVARAAETAREVRDSPLGVVVTQAVARHYLNESPLGNLMADLMREVRPADVAITNGGGLRAELAAGPLTYGGFYQVLPFDNVFSTVRLTGRDLADVVARNLAADRGILLFSGIRAFASCRNGELEVELQRGDGSPIAPEDPLTVTTSDFLANGGDSTFGSDRLGPEAVTIDPSGETIRDAIANLLRQRGGTIDGTDLAYYDPANPRLVYSQPRPVRCAAAGS